MLVVGFAWHFYGNDFQEAGIRGVYEEAREDIQQIATHPTVQNSVSWIRQEIQVLSDRLRENLGKDSSEPAPERPDLAAPSNHSFSIHNIELGDTKQEVEEELGRAKRESENEYGTDWVTYHEDYHHFVMVAYDEDIVSGLYTNQDLVQSNDGITHGSTREDILSSLPSPIESMRKGLINYQIQNNGEYDTFDIDHSYVTIFYDIHEHHQMTALLLIDKDLEAKKLDYFGEPNQALREGLEYQLFDLTNATRVKHGLSALTWEEAALETVRAHSVDMAENNYFSHTNLEGLSPFDRLSEDAISYRLAGENLASGQPSSIFAHEGLMNSLGHRENKLNNGFQTMSVGVAFNEDALPFYTENYLAN